MSNSNKLQVVLGRKIGKLSWKCALILGVINVSPSFASLKGKDAIFYPSPKQLKLLQNNNVYCCLYVE